MKEERKRKLLKILQKKADGSKRKCTKDNSGKTAARPKTRRIQLGLMSYDERNNKCKRVSLVKGGGTRKVDLPADFNRDDVEDEFTSDVSYQLANFKQEPVSKLVDTLGEVLDFTIQKYCELCKTHQFNLYLLVKETPVIEGEQKGQQCSFVDPCVT